MKSVLIAAIGGQGGNVLSEWLFQAATRQGHRAQSVGLPGLAQRGGATSFYLEIAEREDGDDPIFSQFPVPGHVDVIVAQEFLELGRVLQQGYGGPRTTIVASTHRLHAVTEKMPIAGGTVGQDELDALARRLSARCLAVDTVAIARAAGFDEMSANAVLLGLLAASRALPIEDEQYLAGIKATAVAVERNSAAFQVGRSYLERANGHQQPATVPSAEQDVDSFDRVVRQRAAELAPAQRPGFIAVCQALPRRFDGALVPILVEAVARLIDYQDRAYAEQYLRAVVRLAADLPAPPSGWPGATMLQTAARNVATMMAYEDAVRVAQLKTSQARFAAIKERLNVGPDQTYEIVDFLKPDLPEIYGLFPYWLVAPIVALSGLSRRENLPTLEQKPRTSTPAGYLRLRFLLLFKPLRRQSYRYHVERGWMSEYLQDLRRFARIDYELGCLVATTGQMIKGYGAVRRRTARARQRYIRNVITPLYEWERRQGAGFAVTARAAALAKKLLDRDDDGIDHAELFARRVLARAREGDQTRATLLQEIDRLAKEVDPARLLTPAPLRNGPRLPLLKRDASGRVSAGAVTAVSRNGADGGRQALRKESGGLPPVMESGGLPPATGSRELTSAPDGGIEKGER